MRSKAPRTEAKICQYLESIYLEVNGLKETLRKQEKIIKEQSDMVREQSSTIKELQGQVEAIQNQSAEECKQLQEQLDTIMNITVKEAHMQTKLQQSYADMISGGQSSHQQDAPSGPLGPPRLTNTLFCTIDTSRVGEEDKAKTQIANVRQLIEKEIRGNENMKSWRCAAVLKDSKNANRVFRSQKM
jgi:hypothetical protein